MLNLPSQGMDLPPWRATDRRTDEDDNRVGDVSRLSGDAVPVSAPLHDVPLYNSRIIDTYVRLIKKRYNHIDIDDILAYADMAIHQVEDPGHWFRQEQVNRFHERLSKMTRNPNISREAGRYGASPDATGLIRPYVLGMVDPAKAYSLVSRAAGKFTRSTRFESKRLGSSKVEIKVTPFPGVREEPFQCLNRIGFLESITAGFLNKLPKIEHPECIFRGGDCCRYLISWETSLPLLWRRLSPIVLIGLVGWAIGAMLFMPQLSLVTAIAVPLSAFLLLSVVCDHLEKMELKTSLQHLMESTENLLDQININYNNSVITNEIGVAISGKTNVADVLNAIVQTLEKRIDFDRGLILLANKNKTLLNFQAGFGYSPQHRDLIKGLRFHLDRPLSRGVFVLSFRERKPFLINNVDDISDSLSSRSLQFAKTIGSKSFICCPILVDGEPLGILAVDNLTSKRPLVETDLRLLQGISAFLGISIKNAKLIEARERQMRSIMRVLGASIDARDPMTKGHSEKVTEYAMAICAEMGVKDDYTEAVRVAAFLHDYGKIGVPDAVLKKPGELTAEEIQIVQTHAQKTKEILKQINFDGVFKKVPEIAGGHHEKFDGRGYPEGLKGTRIPLGARIIAVADFYEAVTSQRHYHDPMDHGEAVKLLEAEAGSSFDPTIVQAFLRFFYRPQAQQVNDRAMSA